MEWQDLLDGNRLAVVVRPNAPKTRIIGIDDARSAVRVDVAAAPDKNKANKELSSFFAKLSKKKVVIRSGVACRRKVLEFL